MLKNLKVQFKIMVIFLIAGILPILIIACISVLQSRTTLINTLFTEIELYQKMKENNIDTYFEKKIEEGWSLS